MSRHTPGPWFIEREWDMQPGTICILGDGMDGQPWLVCCGSDDCSADEVLEANANLIAAAPDLLAACQEFVRKVESGEARSRRSYAQMKAAIAKARGEQA